MKTTFKLFLSILLLSNFIFAQTGSVYSRYGLGETLPSFSAKVVGLGGTTLSLEDANHLSSSNPAAWNSLQITRFETGIAFSQSLQEQNGITNQNFDNQFLGIRFGFPIEKSLGMVFAFYIEPVTSINYDVQKLNIIEDEDYTERYSGSGGLSKIGFGLSFKLPFNLAIGASFDYFTGEAKYLSEVIFPLGSSYSDSYHELKYQQHAIGYTFGLITNNLSEYLDNSIFTDIKFSATLKSIPNMNVDTLQIIKSDFEEIESEKSTVNMNIPSTISFGMKFDILNQVLLLADFSTTPWTNFEFNNKTTNTLEDSYKVNFGIEYLDRNPKAKTFWNQVPFRAGFTYAKKNYVIDNTNLFEYSASLGLGIPINKGDFIDFAVRYGFRGNLDNSKLVQENFIKLAFSISFGEEWFLRKN